MRDLALRMQKVDGVIIAREDFVGVHGIRGDQGGADGVHGGEGIEREHVAHEGEFFDADAVLAGEGPADGNAVAEDLAGGGEGASRNCIDDKCRHRIW